ncbi:tryptophanase [bacterium]|nr:MAG: tryptophanase [bacterium]
MRHKTIIEPFRIKTVEPIKMNSEEERCRLLREAHYNPFLLNSDDVIIDFLTDSGTSAMSAEQWGGMQIGDESYAGSRSWKRMEKAVRNLTGMDYILPTHQGRAAERILYSTIGGPGKVFVSNTHFDTTRANIEFREAEAIDLPTPFAKDMSSDYPFKGNIDLDQLSKTIDEKGVDNIAGIIMTVTNNSGGGQPVSMENLKQVRKICDSYNIPLILDCCRVAENSYFIKHREKEYNDYAYEEIAKKIFELSDAAIMSSKKDALVNMGGFLALRNMKLAQECTNLLIITEGFTTYGGLSGRDMEALAIGLKEVFEPAYLDYRIKSTEYLGRKLHELGVPIMLPVGGHAVYIDAKKLYSHIPVFEYPGQVLVCELYKLGGIRTVEIGSVMFGKYEDDHKLIPAPYELVRLAIPRRVYTQSHIEYVIETFEEILRRRKETIGLRIIEEPKFLRHFTAKFERLPYNNKIAEESGLE